MPRDPTEYNFPSLTPRHLAVLAQLEMQDQQALRSSAHTALQPSLPVGIGGPVQGTGLGHTQPTNISRALETTQDAQTRFAQSHPTHHEARCIRAVQPPRAAAETAHGIHTDISIVPQTATKTEDPAAISRTPTTVPLAPPLVRVNSGNKKASRRTLSFSEEWPIPVSPQEISPTLVVGYLPSEADWGYQGSSLRIFPAFPEGPTGAALRFFSSL